MSNLNQKRATKIGFYKGHKIRLGMKHTKESKKKISEGNKKRYIKYPELKEKFAKRLQGKQLSKECKQKISNSVKLAHQQGRMKVAYQRRIEATKGAKNPNWKGGIMQENKRIRKSIEMRFWREANFARDNYTCQKCQKKGGKLHPHHIQSFAQCPELRTSIENGITFCKDCHIKFHKIYGQQNNTKEQIYEFCEQ